MTSCIAQLNFRFYRAKPIHVDFCGGQISRDAGLLPVRAFDQRHGLTLSLAERVSDPREDERVRHSVLSLFRQRIYQIIAGYEDANDADLLRHDPAFQILADQPLGEALGSQPTLSRWENAPCRADRLQRRLARRFRRTHKPQRSFSSFLHRAQRWSRQRRICYKAEHTEAGTNLRFLVTNLKGHSRPVFSFYNDRGECENRIEGAPAKPARSRWCKSTALKE